MKIKVIFEAQLREIAGIQEREVELGEDASLLDALKQVADSAALQSRLLAADGTPQPGILLFVNDQPVDGDAATTHI